MFATVMLLYSAVMGILIVVLGVRSLLTITEVRRTGIRVPATIVSVTSTSGEHRRSYRVALRFETDDGRLVEHVPWLLNGRGYREDQSIKVAYDRASPERVVIADTNEQRTTSLLMIAGPLLLGAAFVLLRLA